VRLMAKVTIPLETGDKASESGALPLKMQMVMGSLKPESAYFVEEDGRYECFFVFNLDFAALLQPLFPDLDASFHVTPAMNAKEFQQALGDTSPVRQAVEDSDLVKDLRPEAKTTPGGYEPGDGEPRVTPLGGETVEKPQRPRAGSSRAAEEAG